MTNLFPHCSHQCLKPHILNDCESQYIISRITGNNGTGSWTKTSMSSQNKCQTCIIHLLSLWKIFGIRKQRMFTTLEIRLSDTLTAKLISCNLIVTTNSWEIGILSVLICSTAVMRVSTLCSPLMLQDMRMMTTQILIVYYILCLQLSLP